VLQSGLRKFLFHYYQDTDVFILFFLAQSHLDSFVIHQRCFAKGNMHRMAFRFAVVLLWLTCINPTFDLFAGSIPTNRIPKLRSAAVLVKDMRSGELLMTKQADTAMPIASITKLMTAMVTLDAHLDLDEIIMIQEADRDTLRNSHSRLPIGTRLTRRDALLVALMASENRAARALGRTYPGGTMAMVRAMNEKAGALGLSDTKYEDPAGLSDGNVSSARDLGRLIEKALNYPLICAFSTQADAMLQDGRKQLHFVNTNALVHNSHWQIGLSKTGYIEEAGRCLVMQTNMAQRPVLLVLLNSVGKNTRLADANRIRQWIEGNQTTPKPAKQRKRSSKRRSAHRV
jgi:serine-type D-Ala-D-Ala endopeptidase (penicillin-binding protein 7)